mgnify:CR=1 FL=1
MNMNLKLGPLHFSTKPGEIKDALVGFYNEYLAPTGRLIKEKINAALERHEASKRARLPDGTATDDDTMPDFDDAEVTTAAAVADEPDEIERLEPVREPDCDD